MTSYTLTSHSKERLECHTSAIECRNLVLELFKDALNHTDWIQFITMD